MWILTTDSGFELGDLQSAKMEMAGSGEVGEGIY